MSASIPVHILTGFLGAGKSSLLNAALREPALARSAVLINEFGEVAVDHDLVARVEDGLMITTTGCLCCTASSDVTASLATLAERCARGEIPAFERVIVETTGLADPAPIVTALTALIETANADGSGSALKFHLATVMTLFDTVNGDATLDEHFEAMKQVALADRVVLTKADLALDPASRGDVARARTRLASINPTAVILDRHADWPKITAALASTGAYDIADRSQDAAAWVAAEAVLGHQHDRGSLDPTRHGDDVRAHVLFVDEPLDPKGFYLFLEMLRLSAGAKILRLKGLFALADDPDRPLVVHGVQHLIHPVDRLDRWPSEDRRTRLVLIGRDLKPAIVERMLSTLKPKPPQPANTR